MAVNLYCEGCGDPSPDDNNEDLHTCNECFRDLCVQCCEDVDYDYVMCKDCAEKILGEVSE